MENLNIEELAAKERREYFRAWRAANKDKTAQHRRIYWEKRAAARLMATQTANQSGGENHDEK